MNIKIADFINKELPPEILEQLKVVGRVKHILKPTTTSAISTSESTIGGDQRDVQYDISDLIDEVKDLEDLIEQLEELADQHLKNMEIPAANDTIANAIKNLGGTNKITKPILDKALTMMDYTPSMTMGQDPFLSVLTGDGTIEGARLNCQDMYPGIAKSLKLNKKNPYKAEQIILDQGSKQSEKFKKSLDEMFKDLILILLFKKLWPFLVDLLFINPMRQIARPIDGLIGFFQKTAWRKKDSKWIKEKGVINKLLNNIRHFLYCVVPPIKYRPPIDGVDCSKNPNCKNKVASNNLNNKANMEQSISEIFSDPEEKDSECINQEEFLENVKIETPTGFGISPECIESAKIVLEAALADATTPPETRL